MSQKGKILSNPLRASRVEGCSQVSQEDLYWRYFVMLLFLTLTLDLFLIIFWVFLFSNLTRWVEKKWNWATLWNKKGMRQK